MNKKNIIITIIVAVLCLLIGGLGTYLVTNKLLDNKKCETDAEIKANTDNESETGSKVDLNDKIEDKKIPTNYEEIDYGDSYTGSIYNLLQAKGYDYESYRNFNAIINYGTIGDYSFKVKFEKSNPESICDVNDNNSYYDCYEDSGMYEEKVTIIINNKEYEYWSGSEGGFGIDGLGDLIYCMQLYNINGMLAVVNYQTDTYTASDRAFTRASITFYKESGKINEISNIITSYWPDGYGDIDLPIIINPTSEKIIYYTPENNDNSSCVSTIKKILWLNGEETTLATFEGNISDSC